MIKASDIIQKYISFFEKRGHKRIANAPLVPENDPTTLFTSSGMQPLVPYLLGETHPDGKQLVNVQNCFRAQDIDEVGDNRHTTFFRMLGNWSLGDYFKKEQIPLFFEFLTDMSKGLGLDPTKLYVSIFKGFNNIPKDTESELIWKEKIFNTTLGNFFKIGIKEITVNDNPEKGIKKTDRIFYYGVDRNWWSRSGTPDKMPVGEPGGPDSEVFFDFGKELKTHESSSLKNQPCHPNCQCGRFLEIGNSVFMEYKKAEDGFFQPLPQENVDFGGGLERLLAAVENQQDIFQTSLFKPIIKAVGKSTNRNYKDHATRMRIIADHLVASILIASANIKPSNKEQGYILRRLIRRSLDNFYQLRGINLSPILEATVEEYKKTDEYLVEKFEEIKNTILEEEQNYKNALKNAKQFIEKKYKGKKIGDELMGETKISAEDAFILYSTHGLSPTQIKSLGYTFDEQAFAEKMKQHQQISRKGAKKKFAGGLADHSEKTIMGHTATHLLHQALRDLLGDKIHQSGSNITPERVRFDFNFDRKLTDEEIKKIEDIVNEKIEKNLKVHFEIMPLEKAKKLGAIGLFDEKYQDSVKVYFIGPSASSRQVYSIEFCGGPHVNFTEQLKRFKIVKQENIGKGYRRLYAKVG